AAANDTGAAKAILLGNRHLGAVAGGDAGSAHAARSSSQNEQIKIICAHAVHSPLRARPAPEPGAASGELNTCCCARIAPKAAIAKARCRAFSAPCGLLVQFRGRSGRPSVVRAPLIGARSEVAPTRA